MSYDPIHLRAQNRAEKCNDYNKCSVAYKCKKRTRTSAGHGPAKTEKQSTIDISFLKFLRFDNNRITVNGFDLKFFNQKNGKHTRGNGRSDHAKHVKVL